MLEKEIAASLAQAVIESGTQAGVIKIVSATFSIGALRILDEELFKSEVARNFQGTIAQDSEVVLERPACKMRCLSCGEEYEFAPGMPSTYNCPSCGSDKHELIGGMEIEIGDLQALMPSMSLADKLAKAVEDKLGPVDKPANPMD